MCGRKTRQHPAFVQVQAQRCTCRSRKVLLTTPGVPLSGPSIVGAQLTVPQHSFPATAQFKERSCACFWRDLLKAVSAADHPGGIHPHHGYENGGRQTPGVSPGVSWGRRWGHPTLPTHGSACLGGMLQTWQTSGQEWQMQSSS